MAKRNVARDYAEIVGFAAQYIGKPAIECIDAYAAKRRIAVSRAGRAFWDKVDEGEITLRLLGKWEITPISPAVYSIESVAAV